MIEFSVYSDNYICVRKPFRYERVKIKSTPEESCRECIDMYLIQLLKDLGRYFFNLGFNVDREYDLRMRMQTLLIDLRLDNYLSNKDKAEEIRTILRPFYQHRYTNQEINKLYYEISGVVERYIEADPVIYFAKKEPVNQLDLFAGVSVV